MAGQRIGYVRVSTFEQNAQRQLDEIPVDRLFIDQASGKDTQRPQLETMLAKQRGAYRGRKHSLSAAQVTDLKIRIAAGERKAHVARELGVSRETVYQYLRAPA